MLSNAAYLSAWKGSALLRLPIDAREFDAYFQKRVEGSAFQETSAAKHENAAGEYLSRWQVQW